MSKYKNTYKNTEKVMEDYGIRITDEIVALLARNKKNASKVLTNSIDFKVIKSKIGLQLVIDYIDYGPKIRNKKTGVAEGNVIRGRRAGSKQPPIVAIEKWIGEKKIEVIKVVRDITGKGLKEAKDIVDAAAAEPQTIKEAVKKEEAEELKKKFDAAGAQIELK